eukprot:4910989-Pyramimonas_sp.AAC.1
MHADRPLSGSLGHHAPHDPAQQFGSQWQRRPAAPWMRRTVIGLLRWREQIFCMGRLILISGSFTRRARGPACRWKLARSTPGRPRMRDEQTEWWCTTSTP